ncbi:hypothetical protein B0H14DRAFT_149719 [Mycena olivaceomarginata]|nr:hypothetical protein B0H14DRAFT_149719 [Mycena olivaceomarginata]
MSGRNPRRRSPRGISDRQNVRNSRVDLPRRRRQGQAGGHPVPDGTNIRETFGNRAVSTSRCVRNSRARASTSTDAQDMEMSGADGAASAVSGREVGDTYSPDILPDHQAPYFAHEKSVLVQCQIKDKNGMLIAPHELYRGHSLLDLGFALDIHQQAQEPAALGFQVYHVNVEKLTILDKGDGAPWNPPSFDLTSAVPTTPSKRSVPFQKFRTA